MKLPHQTLIDLAIQGARLPYVKNALVVFEGNRKARDEFLHEVAVSLTKKGMAVKVHRQRGYIQVIGGPHIYVEYHSGEGAPLTSVQGREYQHIIYDEPMVLSKELMKTTFPYVTTRLRG